MYGGGGGNYTHQQISQHLAPQYHQHPQQQQTDGADQNKIWMPEIGKAPSMAGALKGGSSNVQYAYLNMADEEDVDKLLLPDSVTPHNEPWTSGYKKMGTID